ncbi:hypothetical protein ES705_24650 [subsurface metagenome]
MKSLFNFLTLLIFLLFILSITISCDSKTDFATIEQTAIFPEKLLKEYIKSINFVHGPIPEYEKRASIIIVPRDHYIFRFELPNGTRDSCDVTDTASDIKKILPAGGSDISSITHWPQDMFKVIINKGTLEFILSSQTPWHLSLTEEDILEYINYFFDGHRITKAPFYFDGGDILFDRFNGKSYVFTDSTHKEHDVKGTFRADKSINLPFEDDCIHLDEILLFVGHGRVCVASIIGYNLTKEEEKRFSHLSGMLSKSRDILSSLGYSIVNIPVDYSDIRNETTHLNCIQFKDHSNLSNIIVPLFENTNQELFKQVISLYRQEVVNVHLARDVIAPFGGSLHCITHIIF